MKKWLAKGLDKIVWMLAGGVLLAVFNFWLKDISSDIVVRHYLETVETGRPIPARIGSLDLDYQMPTAQNEAVYKVEAANEGRGPEEDLRILVDFGGPALKFHAVPNLRIFKPGEVLLDKDSFFMNLFGFPKGAMAAVAFLAPEEHKQLCAVKIEVAGKERLGRVERLKGVRCD